MKVENLPSPNFGSRRNGLLPELAVIHYTAMDSDKSALERLSAPEFEVSCHYFIGGNGSIYRMVDERMRAWHAGAGSWGGREDVNSRSIGIEISNSGVAPYSAVQMKSLELLLRDIMARWSIPPEGVIGHSDLAVGRKADPGPKFDWRRLALSGLSVWPDEGLRRAAKKNIFLEFARRFGYELPKRRGRHEFASLLYAFRARFRPYAQGPLDEWDVGAIANLADRWPRSLV